MKAKIINIKDETYDTKTFRVKPEHKIKFKSGQFFIINMIINNKLEKRSYSVSSSPLKDYIEFTIKLVPNGLFSNNIFKAEVGTELNLEGPYGKFVFEDNSCKKVVLIGAGSGVAPLRGILQYILKKKLNVKPFIYFYYKTKDDIIYKDELEKLPKNIDINISLTRDEYWQGLKGRINKDHINHILEDDQHKLFYICGPNDFVSNAKKLLIDNGIKLEHIKNEIYG